MDSNIAWFVGGVIIMTVLGFWVVLWYRSSTKPIIVPYTSPTRAFPIRSSAQTQDSLRPSGSPAVSQGAVSGYHTVANPQFLPNPSTSTLFPTISLPASGTPSPSVFPPQQ